MNIIYLINHSTSKLFNEVWVSLKFQMYWRSWSVDDLVLGTIFALTIINQCKFSKRVSDETKMQLCSGTGIGTNRLVGRSP